MEQLERVSSDTFKTHANISQIKRRTQNSNAEAILRNSFAFYFFDWMSDWCFLFGVKMFSKGVARELNSGTTSQSSTSVLCG